MVYRRGLGGDLDPGDEQLGLAAPAQQVARAGDAERLEHRGVEVDDVPARVEAEHLELGADPLGVGHLRQPAGRDLARRVAEVEGELRRRGRRRAVATAGDLRLAPARPRRRRSARRDAPGRRLPPRSGPATAPRGADGARRAAARRPGVCRSRSATCSSRSRRVTRPRRRTGLGAPMP